MSLVCFPFKEEDVAVVVRNLECAASHPSVTGILCVGFSRGETWFAIEGAKASIEKSCNVRVHLLLQKRIGLALRGGKGDGMNTALGYFLEHPEFTRLHFYDADIVSFSAEWISKAEKQADLGFDVVRHYFPRSSTDAMITWFVTKIGFALLWPNTVLPVIEQPLGGELLLTRKAAEVLYSDQRVRAQSDWGIDTLYTFVSAQQGLSLAEVYIPEGKVHALYGGLRDLRTMLVECFSAIQSLKREAVPADGVHRMESAKAVPELVKQKVGYDIEKTLKLLAKQTWSQGQRELLNQHFDPALAKGLQNASEWPCWGFADEEAWIGAYQKFLEHFEKGNPDWEELLFKVWVARVVNHTMRNVMRGYDCAMGTLRDFLWDTIQKSTLQQQQTKLSSSGAVHSLYSGHSAAESLANGQGKIRKKAKWSTDTMCAVQQ
ncbi:hypothetical protein MPTK1_3g15460 [Marchantia polymorpha subsp. ruderalis]|uniref:Uncharacterized protein n=2 Tax=Marchantia polymorpha TaxID=3197 RepID=A0AAF6B140_MARPO|nr:hypothetical protein MARPO_0004s0126 [Marchantia polymorpha]BBN05724.1 hypothetical protein Mp_3g15460 [Marchantia polymorpha subsp. ruderalis]|eukprot:PTQ48857.1 hypothetical protein MARPO_0004s0126 [Marchantia polymorpha]